jgi:Domain of unknown function (DUF1707)
MMRIRHAGREGRLPPALCEVRLRSAARAKTTEDLARLTSDLGGHEGASPLRLVLVLGGLAVIAAAWEPVVMSGFAWLLLAVPVTALAAYAMWMLPEYLA